MNYTVIWGPVSESHLATAWLAAPDREAVTVAAHELDLRLGDDPLRLGEARESSVHRVTFELPLGIEFEVIEDDKKVIVQGCGWCGDGRHRRVRFWHAVRVGILSRRAARP